MKKENDTNLRKSINNLGRVAGIFISGILLILFSGNISAQTTTIPSGSFIVDMGVTPQTVGNGLKPYGMLYALLQSNVPVYWVINPSKTKDGIDFSHAGIDYRGGPLIIEAKYRTPAVNTIISSWQAQGVVGTTTTSPISNVPVYLTFSNVPAWTMDKQNGSLAVPYFSNAGIPAAAHGGSNSNLWTIPGDLDCCDDIFVMPHADPVWSTHQRLVSWNLDCKAALWNACHSPSALENMVDNITPNRDLQANFLTIKDPAWKGTTGVWTQSNSLILWGSHADGSPPYTFNNTFAADPIAQYLGTIDAATQNGSEQIYMPRQGTVSTNPSFYEAGAVARWRPETKILVYDPTQANVTNPNLSTLQNVAVVMAYGRGFGDPLRGNVMHQAGHSHAKATGAANVAAQRAFFNFSFLAAWEKAVLPVIGPIPGVVYSGQEYPLSFSTVANVPPAPVQTYTLLWSASCGGTFLDPVTRLPDNTRSNAIYIPPSASTPISCTISLTITDDCGRTTFDSEALVVECNLELASQITNPCYNTSNAGAIDIILSDPLTVTSWAWTRAEGGSGSGSGTSITGLAPGTYTVEVTASNGCIDSFTVTLTQSPQIFINAIPTPVACSGGSTGSISTSVSGGIPGYIFAWTGDNGFTSSLQNLSGLPIGTYNLTVTDSKGCQQTATTTVTQSDAMVITSKISDLTCYGINNGIINLSVTGGTSPYTYLWNDGNNSQNRPGLAPGTYSVTVTDANNCTQALSGMTVTQPAAALTLSATQINVFCFGNATGSINLTAAGGTSPYTYAWTGTGGYTSSLEDISDLAAGTYNVTVTDNNSCTANLSVTFTQVPAMVLSTAVIHPTCPTIAPQNNSDGSIILTVTNGTPGYTYNWTGPGVFTAITKDISNLITGTYNVTVTDSKGCTKSTSVTLTNLKPILPPPGLITQ